MAGSIIYNYVMYHADKNISKFIYLDCCTPFVVVGVTAVRGNVGCWPTVYPLQALVVLPLLTDLLMAAVLATAEVVAVP